MTTMQKQRGQETQPKHFSALQGLAYRAMSLSLPGLDESFQTALQPVEPACIAGGLWCQVQMQQRSSSFLKIICYQHIKSTIIQRNSGNKHLQHESQDTYQRMSCLNSLRPSTWRSLQS